LACICIVYGLFVLYIFLVKPLTTGFQAYTPTTLPSGVRTTGHVTQQFLYYGDKHVDIGTNVPAFYVSENEVADDELMSVYSCGWLAQTTCTIHTSPKGQKYHVLISDDSNGVPLLDTISWIRGETFIMITIEDSAATRYANINWSKIVDGFISTNYGYERGSVTRRQTGV
jgi:hypothetical protein